MRCLSEQHVKGSGLKKLGVGVLQLPGMQQGGDRTGRPLLEAAASPSSPLLSLLPISTLLP